MYGSELRTFGLGGVVAVVLGAGIGVVWHYFADSATGKTMTAAATPLAHQDAPNPALSCPPDPREGIVPDVPRLPALSRSNNQADTPHATGALKVTHAAHSRARRADRPDSGERMTF